MTTSQDTNDRIAVITGGASGFGLALGARCAAAGMRIVLSDRDGARAKDEAARLASEHGIEALGLPVDVADAEAVASLAAAVDEQFARVDLVL